MSGKEKKVVCTFQPDLPLCSLLMIPFFNNSSNYNKAPRHKLPFEFAAEKIPHLNHLEMEFYLITCIFEVGNYLGEHLDGYFSSSSLKILFCLWEIWIEERILFPLCYNDTLHLGTFFYQHVLFINAPGWFCLIVTLCTTGLKVQLWHFIVAFSCALEISRKKVPGRGKEMGKFNQSRSCQTKTNPEGGKIAE